MDMIMKYFFPLPVFLLLGAISLAACGADTVPSEKAVPDVSPRETTEARRVLMPRLHEAVGTVQARTEIRVESQVTGRVLKILVHPGDTVRAGDELVVLDSRAAQARLEQARQALESVNSLTGQARDVLGAAKADFDKTESTYRRMKQLNSQKVVTDEEVEKAESAFLQAKARLGQAQEGLAAARSRGRESAKVVQEAEIGLGYTTIKAQEAGEVARRQAEPGDLAFPGKELLTLQTGTSLRLEAMVREGLIDLVHLGDSVDVIIAALRDPYPLSGTVDEIEPLADPVTRSFLVKVRLPEVPGVYPGMFGRLRVPLGERETVLVPEKAITRVGQLETVRLCSGETWQTVFVRTGTRHGPDVEILSGLSGGEILGLGAGEE